MALDVGALYAEHWQDVFSFLRRRLHGVPDAEIEDLTATVWERIVRAAPAYQERSPEQERGWVYEIARNLLVDIFRQRKRIGPGVYLSDAVLDGRARLDAGSARHDYALDLEAMIHELPDRQLLAVREVYWAGATHDEAALVLGVDRSAVGKLLARALINLRKRAELLWAV